jgi:hypothetical protein
MSRSKTKVELEQEVDDLSSILGAIYDEADSEQPDVDRIREMAADGLGLEEEDLTENDPED